MIDRNVRPDLSTAAHDTAVNASAHLHQPAPTEERRHRRQSFRSRTVVRDNVRSSDQGALSSAERKARSFASGLVGIAQSRTWPAAVQDLFSGRCLDRLDRLDMSPKRDLVGERAKSSIDGQRVAPPAFRRRRSSKTSFARDIAARFSDLEVSIARGRRTTVRTLAHDCGRFSDLALCAATNLTGNVHSRTCPARVHDLQLSIAFQLATDRQPRTWPAPKRDLSEVLR